MKRKIAVITSSRADYSHLYWPLKDLAAHPDVDLQLIAMASHLSPAFGSTIQQIEKDGFALAGCIECLLSSDTDIGMAKTIGIAVQSLADLLGRMRPDLLLLIADRYEMLAPACVALALRIPIAHIEGGEVSEGAIDDAVRNALTKMSHLHFTSTYHARARVIAMGEEGWRVHRAGAPSLDHLRRSALLTRGELEARLKIDLTTPPILVAYHPVTLRRETTEEAAALFAALENVTDTVLFCYPNADAGSHLLIQRTQQFLRRRQQGRVFVNLDAVTYWSLLRHVGMLVGNSSSGIMETASFALPTVNVGFRQKGRERARNVFDVEPETSDILAKISIARSEAFRASLAGMENPYGDGHAAERILRVLTQVPLGDSLLIKRAPDLSMPDLPIPAAQ
jgi:UDP-N-acetylglucosamine 2-epimerase (non-hydrolysing)/GDP/UDP-N,N'-diacetylbacillosamine 2-epimerase (hydrolysing)